MTLEKRWEIAPRLPEEVNNALSEYTAPMRQILFNRGVCNAQEARRFLDGFEECGDPFLLTDMEIAVNRLLRAVDEGEAIAVYGDYDVDGVTATALMVQVLRRLGGNVTGYIPNRFDEGYGLNNEALDHLASSGVRVVLTVDCGIRSPREAEHARAVGIDLIISDHHHPQDEIPPALAVICHKRPGDMYPDQNLAGVGLAYKIAQALFTRRPLQGVVADDWLDLVALGTVADIVPLKGENRMLVRDGLEQLRRGFRPGLVSLANVAQIHLPRINAADIGFGLGPRLNAAGRLESALDAYALLMAESIAEAGPLAQKLDNQNRDRQRVTQEMQLSAESLTGEIRNLIFAAHPEFNSGVVGLVAARLTETYYRPSVIGAIGEEFTRASCRSIPEFHITNALDECADLLVRHGGHALAAGFTVRNENITPLVERLTAIADRELGERDLQPVLRVDLEIRLKELNQILPRSLEQLQPTGQGNPEAVFVSRGVQVVQARQMGDGKHLRMIVQQDGIRFPCVAFRQGHLYDSLPEMVDIAYHFEENHFNGNVTLQLNVRDIKPAMLDDDLTA